MRSLQKRDRAAHKSNTEEAGLQIRPDQARRGQQRWGHVSVLQASPLNGCFMQLLHKIWALTTCSSFCPCLISSNDLCSIIFLCAGGPPPGLAFGAFHLLAQSSSSSSNSSRSATPELTAAAGKAVPSLAAAAAAAHQRAGSSALSQSVSALDQDGGRGGKNRGGQQTAHYSVAFLLAMSTSKLVCRPDNLPALKHWFGYVHPFTCSEGEEI